MLKRIFDIVLSALGLIILFPFFVIFAIWIKLDSKGNVFFRQTRVGLHGELFRIHKFRTMVVNSEVKGGLTIGNDARVTNAGKFLRKFKIDELPQLIDVFLGQMSLVGPRPEIEEFMSLYEVEIRQRILSVRPGITDKASIEMVDENEILGKYDNPRQAYIDIIMPIKAKYYIDYANNHSILGDIKIILMTIKKIVIR
ncbi:glycosyl transferase [Vespertiliibacter pulmonis]|uniref:Lipopolysaccharide/colanic/teichoic acid biosynthesis glycosyltransferase n=1 Tax=Vespertiliibacter pulmonis TaxID=1443036 RepID=A0A3N4W9C3_9PAST|nr:sugar transferase [Vespertiliibacter pulmonis]QLB20569.1 glycosyl transferase [Vespertiliibacter pulmonis]RPE82700.1 lipopolysaccharide/colanic/teichoic acid biosynthesis glycosyltransferase [Vespertiliibacter pulmonis]